MQENELKLNRAAEHDVPSTQEKETGSSGPFSAAAGNEQIQDAHVTTISMICP
jgi:hypothetical protein